MMGTKTPLSKQSQSAIQVIAGNTRPTAICGPEMPDTGNPTAIVGYLVNVLGRQEASLEDIQALYTGSVPLTLESLCARDDLALTVDKRFIPLVRFLGGDLYAKKDACEKAAALTGSRILRAKWEEQAARLEQNFSVSGIENITFGLRQKWIPSSVITEFLAEQGFTASVSPTGEFRIARSTRHGEYIPPLERYLRGAQYGQNAEFAQPLENYLNGRAIGGPRKWEYSARLEDLEAAFEEWIQGHPDIAALIDLYNRNFNNYRQPSYETGPLDIAEYLSGTILLHPYQNAEARRLLDEGKGICAFAVGLGKTAMALSLAACGIKQKKFSRVCIVVPQSVLSTWQREAGALFSAAYLRQVIRVVSADSKPHGNAISGLCSPCADTPCITIMTKECFCSLPMLPETIQDFLGHARAYSNIDGEKLLSDAGKEQTVPFFEELAFDCLILDEAHVFKNSYEPTGRMKKIAYLSTPPVSKNALNVAAKAHYIRTRNQGNGVYALTATPITNSPFEIFNMLSLVCPPSEFSGMGIYTIEDIITVFGKVKLIGTMRVSGAVTPREALLGFRNLDGLRNLFTRYVSLKDANAVTEFFTVPDRQIHGEIIPLAVEQSKRYEKLRKQALKTESGTENSLPILGIIREMDRLTIDIDFQERKITFVFAEEQAENVEFLLALLPPSCPQPEFCPKSMRWAITDQPLIPETGRLADGSIWVRLPETFEAPFVAMLPEVGLSEEDVSHPLNPKYERLIDRARQYLGQGGKQLVFTEEKSQHGKLRRLLARHLDLPLSRIAVINADEASGSRIMRIERAYNTGDVAIVIANRKAELGINLQNGTTAVHHLTLPWTPASIEQRNGRGIRQGNSQPHVDIHYYFGQKTFDEYRCIIVQVKANWIAELLSGKVAVLDNPEVMDIEEILDMLASSPEEAKQRREARMEAAQKALEHKQRSGIFNALRALTVLHDTVHAESAPLQVRRGKLQSRVRELEQKVDSAKIRLEQCTAQYTTLPSLPPPQREKEQRALRERWVDLRKKSLELQETLAMAALELANLEELSKETLEKYAQQARQTELYLRRAHDAGKLPFPIDLLEELGQFAIIPPPHHAVIRVGDTFREEIADRGSFRLFRVAAVRPGKATASVVVYDPEEGASESEIPLRKMAIYPAASFDAFALEHSWRYGTLHSMGIFTRETFEVLARRMRFVPEGGAVYSTSDGLHITWNAAKTTPLEAVPVWPEPHDPAFREALCRRYLADRVSGGVNVTLMRDLLGAEFATIALAYAEGEEAELFQLMGAVMEQAKKITSLDADDPEAIAAKVQAFLRAQAALQKMEKPGPGWT